MFGRYGAFIQPRANVSIYERNSNGYTQYIYSFLPLPVFHFQNKIIYQYLNKVLMSGVFALLDFFATCTSAELDRGDIARKC